MNLKPHLITAEGLAKITEDLKHLKTIDREEVADRLHRAFEDGQDDDFVDNAELEAARNAQSFLEGRIKELEEIIKNHQIIKNNSEPHESVRVGDWVTVTEDGYDEEEKYMLVGAAEADPANSRISNESPLGKALLGAKKGDIVRVNAPRGVLEFRVLKIG
ncbi:MAG: transcription elongation factor GreA [Anaerolineae bacterium]